MSGVEDFISYHEPAVLRDEVKHGLMLDILRTERHGFKIDTWDFDRPGACAIKVSGWRIVDGALTETHWSLILGDITREEAFDLAAQTAGLPSGGVIGIGETAQWYACRAVELGMQFHEVEPQQIYMLTVPPASPNVSGRARKVVADDRDHFFAWLLAFCRESAPHDPMPVLADADWAITLGRYFYWLNEHDEPVAMAGIARQLPTTTAITGVYTPPALRGKGYAAAVTAATVNHILAEDRRIVTLYTDLRVPAANRCYWRLGFRGVYTSLHFHR